MLVCFASSSSSSASLNFKRLIKALPCFWLLVHAESLRSYNLICLLLRTRQSRALIYRPDSEVRFLTILRKIVDMRKMEKNRLLNSDLSLSPSALHR